MRQQTGGRITMASHLFALCFRAHDPLGLARFWGGVLNREVVDDPRDGILLQPGDDTGIRLRFSGPGEQKSGQNRMHFDLTSTSPEHRRQTVAAALALGARHIDIGQGPDAEHDVLADPEGNEFCVIPPGNTFLAGCGFTGALACDGSQEVGYFWSEALGWPLVWDQDQETAIQSPHGGTKITWGGPPLMPRPGKEDRLYFDLAPSAGGDQDAEAGRLVSLGATRLGRDDAGRVLMADPDGNAFGVLTPR
jgi:hypothetical protein